MPCLEGVERTERLDWRDELRDGVLDTERDFDFVLTLRDDEPLLFLLFLLLPLLPARPRPEDFERAEAKEEAEERLPLRPRTLAAGAVAELVKHFLCDFFDEGADGLFVLCFFVTNSRSSVTRMLKSFWIFHFSALSSLACLFHILRSGDSVKSCAHQ